VDYLQTRKPGELLVDLAQEELASEKDQHNLLPYLFDIWNPWRVLTGSTLSLPSVQMKRLKTKGHGGGSGNKQGLIYLKPSVITGS
jgi:hypothetical protein